MPDLLTMALASLQVSNETKPTPVVITETTDVDTFYKPEPVMVTTPVETIKELKGQKYDKNSAKSIQ